MATSLYPLVSKREMMLPTIARCTPSGLIIMYVRSAAFICRALTDLGAAERDTEFVKELVGAKALADTAKAAKRAATFMMIVTLLLFRLQKVS